MGRRFKTRKQESARLAAERIRVLFARAESFFAEDPLQSRRCVELARRIAMRHRVRISPELSRRYCRNCHAFLVPGVNARVRITAGAVRITCTECGYIRRYRVKGDHGRRQ